MMVDSVLRDFAKKYFGNSETQNIYILGGEHCTDARASIHFKRKESPAQRARANRFFDVFSRKAWRNSIVERARLFLFVCFSWIVGRFCLISGSYGSTIGAPLEHYRGNIGAAWELCWTAI